MLSKGLFVGFSCHVTLFLSNSGGEDQGPDGEEAHSGPGELQAHPDSLWGQADRGRDG